MNRDEWSSGTLRSGTLKSAPDTSGSPFRVTTRSEAKGGETESRADSDMC